MTEIESVTETGAVTETEAETETETGAVGIVHVVGFTVAP